MELFAQLDNHGTAMSETALCVHHLKTHRDHMAVTKDTARIPAPDLNDTEFHSCENEALACNVCGATIHTPDLVGKTIKAVSFTEVDGAFGDEPATVLTFTDGTEHTFVHPAQVDF